MVDLGDLLDGFGPDLKSNRPQRVIRVLFGLLGLVLSAAGAWQMRGYDAGLHFRIAAVILFFFLGAFFLVNVILARNASWSWKGLFLTFALLFVVRILFGP
jgi:hypothetical protein